MNEFSDEVALMEVKALLGIEDTEKDTLLTVYLEIAKREVISHLYSLIGIPKDPTIPYEYENTVVQAVVVGYNLVGAENELTHNENGINRTFHFDSMLAYIRNNVIPYGRVCKVTEDEDETT